MFRIGFCRTDRRTFKIDSCDAIGKRCAQKCEKTVSAIQIDQMFSGFSIQPQQFKSLCREKLNIQE